MGLPCPKCGGHVSGAGHSCTDGPPSTSEILLTQMAEIERMEADVENGAIGWSIVADFRKAVKELFPNRGDGCDQLAELYKGVAALKDRIVAFEAGTEISDKPADYCGRKVIRQLPADSPYPPEDGYEEG